MNSKRVVVVSKRTEYGRFVDEEHDPRVRRLLEEKNASVADWKREHKSHVRTLAAVERALRRLRARYWVLHGPRVVFDASDAALIVTVGGDGTLLAASHHVTSVPILGINSSPGYSVGFFCAGLAQNAEELLAGALDGTLTGLSLSRMQVTVAGRIVARRVLNEALFCHKSPAAAARYLLSIGKRREEQLSSGVWVCTAAGSTGAAYSAGGDALPLDSSSLEVVVREPFAALGRRHGMTKMTLHGKQSACIVSKMSDGCVFLDGPFHRVPVRLGDSVAFSVSAEPLTVLGLAPERASEAPITAKGGRRSKRAPTRSQK